MPITYREWILKQQFTKQVEQLHLSVAERLGWLNDLVEDTVGVAAVVFYD
jgi:hypothetical protein